MKTFFVAQKKMVVLDDHLLAWRQQVNVVRLNFHFVFRQLNRHLAVPGKQFVHHAAEVWGKVLYDDKSHPRVRRKIGEKVLERFEAAGGGAYSHDAESGRRAFR